MKITTQKTNTDNFSKNNHCNENLMKTWEQPICWRTGGGGGGVSKTPWTSKHSILIEKCWIFVSLSKSNPLLLL